MKTLMIVITALMLSFPTVSNAVEYDTRYMVDLGFRILDQMNTQKSERQYRDTYDNRSRYNEQTNQINLESQRMELRERELRLREREIRIRERELGIRR